jgi:hypothetical protein
MARHGTTWQVLNFLTSYINYGGRVTDAKDLRTINVLLQVRVRTRRRRRRRAVAVALAVAVAVRVRSRGLSPEGGGQRAEGGGKKAAAQH